MSQKPPPSPPARTSSERPSHGPARAVATAVTSRTAADGVNRERSSRAVTPPNETEGTGATTAVVPRTSDFEHFVRVDRHGRVLTGHGEIDQLAALSSYAVRIADLVGDLLNFGPSLAIEASFAHGSIFAYRDTTGDVIGLKPHARVSLRSIRARLQL